VRHCSNDRSPLIPRTPPSIVEVLFDNLLVYLGVPSSLGCCPGALHGFIQPLPLFLLLRHNLVRRDLGMVRQIIGTPQIAWSTPSRPISQSQASISEWGSFYLGSSPTSSFLVGNNGRATVQSLRVYAGFACTDTTIWALLVGCRENCMSTTSLLASGPARRTPALCRTELGNNTPRS
jgi:hypothetical protein